VLFSGTRLKKVLIAGVLLGAVFFLYLRHEKVESSGSLRWFDRPVVFVVSPAVRAVTAVRDRVSRTFERYFFLKGVERENEVLRAENARLKERDVVLSGLEEENRKLLATLDLKGRLSGKAIAARVTASPPVATFRVITVNRGSDDGVRRRAPVVSADGLVGQVSRVFPGTSQVLLITDPTSAVDGRLDPSGARGLVVGKSLKLGLKRDLYISAFEYLSQSTDISEGATVVTSGMDGVYPPGIPIGRVHARKKKQYDIFQQAEVIPAVDFFKLSEVLILP
jgi:rod shape-determining protein MreC